MSVGEVEGEGSLREASWARSDASVAEEVEEEAEAEAEEVSMEELSLEISLEASDDEELREMQGAVVRLREQLAVRRRHAEALLAEAHLSEHQQRKHSEQLMYKWTHPAAREAIRDHLWSAVVEQNSRKISKF